MKRNMQVTVNLLRREEYEGDSVIAKIEQSSPVLKGKRIMRSLNIA